MMPQSEKVFPQLMEVLIQRFDTVRTFFHLKNSSEKAFIPEKEYRFPIELLPIDFLNDIKNKPWSKEQQEVDIVLMHPNENGFVARLRKSDKCYLQFKVQKESRLWEEVSIPISAEETMLVFETLKEFLEPRVVVSKKRKWYSESDKLRLYLDEVEGLGRFVEIESEDQSADTFMKKFGIDAKLSAEPYGKLLLQKPIDMEKSLDMALKQMAFPAMNKLSEPL